MAVNYCINCTECTLVSINCLCSAATPLHAQLAKTRLNAVIQDAQDNWVMGILQQDCFEALCAAIAEDIAGTTELSDDWKTLLNRYIVPLVINAATYRYLRVYGFDGLSISVDDNDEYLKRLYQDTIVSQNRLKKYLENNVSKYPCYVPDEDYCGKPVELVDGVDFSVESRYGQSTGDYLRDKDPYLRDRQKGAGRYLPPKKK